MNTGKLILRLPTSRPILGSVRMTSSGQSSESGNQGSDKSSGLSQLGDIVSKMKVSSTHPSFYQKIEKFRNPDMFDYAFNKKYSKKLTSKRLKLWSSSLQDQLPSNGFEDLIRLTEEGKLWKYPIDNEQGLDAEKGVPFEDHVFLDHLLEDFPQNDYIQSYMQLVIAGLGKNYWMTVERKHEIVRFYKEFFEEKKELFEMEV